MSAQPPDVSVTRLANIKVVTKVKLVGLAAVVDEIASNDKLRLDTERLRALRGAGEKAAYDTSKLKLPAVLFAGEFNPASDSGLQRHSGLMVVDFDGLTEVQVSELRQAMSRDPHTAIAFVSPSGEGVKWVVAVNVTDADSHKRCWKIAAEYAQTMFRQSPDKAGAEVSRKCFLCHDADVIFTEPSKQFECTVSTSKPSSFIIGEKGGLGGIGETGGLGEKGGTGVTNGDTLSGRPRFARSAVRVAEYLPTCAKKNHEVFLFNLARHVKRIERDCGCKASVPDVDSIAAQWHKLASREFAPHSLEDYQNEFANILEAARCPEGVKGAVIKEAFEHAQASPLPHIDNLRRYSPHLGLFVDLVNQLAKEQVGREVFLAQTEIAKQFNVTQPTISGYIARLVRMNIITRTKAHQRGSKAQAGRAAYYEFHGVPEGTDQQFSTTS